MLNNDSWRNYAKVNADSVARFAICGFLWYGKDPAEHFKQVETDKQGAPTWAQRELAENARNMYMSAAASVDGLLKLVNIDRARCVNPAYKTAAEYIKHEFETDLTAAQIVSILPKI